MTTQRVDAGSTGASAAVRRLPVLDRHLPVWILAADAVTMRCGDICPVFPGKRYLDRQLSDPAGRTVAGTRPIRDEIDARVRTMLTELVPEPSV